MALREIVKYGDDILRKKCRPVTAFDEKLHILLDDMRETLAKAEGAGLAAPQVGMLRRVVIIDVHDKNGVIELINPEIIETEGVQCGGEGCLSLPGEWHEVERPLKVTVKAQDRDGKEFTLTGEGLLARAFCHELDHLEGVLFIDRMKPET
ncbi:MAG: peptide deformylase [Oscillospiraceae bacterium]|nr:peptide deformylase [Oscillospiraceae bacterium]